nr:ferric reductase-like transmembrane domain-containing protein [Desulfopila sp. IMCC35006]
MHSQTNRRGLLPAILLFTGLPIFIYATGDFPRRTLLKESISLLTIIGFCMMLAQFFLTRSGNSLLLGSNMAKVIKIHKIIGYVFVCIILVHPFLIVLPRYFEAGLDPAACLITILRTYSNSGILIGIFAWCLMSILLVTAIFRKKIPLPYKTWVQFHKWLSIACMIFACWHALDLGRHTDRVLSAYIILLAFCGILLPLKNSKSPTVLQSEISRPGKGEISRDSF